MKLEFINSSIQSVVEYLPKLQLKGWESRARHKLLKKATETFQEFYSDVQEIKFEHPNDSNKQNAELDKLLNSVGCGIFTETTAKGEGESCPPETVEKGNGKVSGILFRYSRN